MRIRNKINISFLVTYFLVVIFVALAIGFYTTELIKSNVSTYLTSSNRARAEHIRTFINDQEKTAIILAAASVYRDFLNNPTNSEIKAKIDRRLIRTIEADPQINESFIIDVQGKIVASSDKTHEGLDKSNEPYYLNGKKEIFIKDVYYSDLTNKLNYTISAPIKDDNGILLGVSVLRYLPNNFFSIVKNENGLGATEESFLVNGEGLFITPSRFLDETYVLKQKITTENLNDCFQSDKMAYVAKYGYSNIQEAFGNQLIEIKDYRNKDVLLTDTYIPETNWCLVTKIDKTYFSSFRESLSVYFVLIFSLAGILFLLIGYLISGRITKPIHILQSVTNKIKQGDFNNKADVSSHDEVGELAESFNVMMEAVKKSRAEIDIKVKEQTKDISKKAKELAEQKNAILNILKDVETEKIKVELLANDLEKFKLAVDNASDQVVITDPDGIVLYANRMIEKIAGYTVEEVLGKKAGALWSSPMSKEYYEKFWNTIKNKKLNFTGEIDNRRKNGEVYTAAISVSPVLDANGKILFFVGLERDITREKEVDREKTEFVSLASHQLKTPVGSIAWNLEMLENGDYGALTETQKEIVSEMYGMNRRMNELINGLLNISRIEMGVFVIDPSPTNFANVCEDVLNEMKPRIIAKGHKVTKKYAKDLPLVSADPNLLRIIFQNFISNAIKYTPSNGKVGVNIEIKDNNILISVSNNGEPIPSKDKDKMFSKMFRASNAQAQDPDGNGIGLYLAKKIVENGGGKIWFDSEEGKDTVFYVSFPLTGMLKKEGTKVLT